MSVKDAVKKARVCFVAALPVIFFLAGIIWVLLFPAVSITTGEMKPRGMYVDEHSLLVQSGIVGKPAMVPVNSIIDSLDICGALDRSKLRCSYAPVEHVNESSIIQIEITPRHAKTNFDSTVLVFRYKKETSVQNEVLRLVSSVAAELAQSRWNTRKVIVLLLPTSKNTQNNAESAALSSWLQRHHKPTFEQIRQSELHSRLANNGGGGDVQYMLQVGTIREAYIFDLTDHTIWPEATSTSETHTISSRSTTAIAITTPTTPHTLHFTSATLLHTGADGLLPNMDLIAYPLSLYPRILQAESQVCGDGLYVYLQKWYDGASVCSSGSGGSGSNGGYNVCSIAESVARQLLPLIQTIDNTLPHAYKHRLLSLLCTIHTLSTNTATGLHGYFSHLNIDSITIKPTYNTPGAANKPTTQAKGLKKRPRTSTGSTGGTDSTGGVEKYDISTLLEMVMSCVYVSNNLQEELHHSHFYYLMMGSGHFVGINEYGFTAALFLASVLCMFVQLCGVHSAGNSSTADPVSGSVVGEKSSMRQCTGDGVAKKVFGSVLIVVVPVVWVLCVPILYTTCSIGCECSTISGSTIVNSVYTAYLTGRMDTVLQVFRCMVQCVQACIVHYIPIERAGGVTLTLYGVACVSAFLVGISSKHIVVGNSDSDSSVEVNGISSDSADQGNNAETGSTITTQLASTNHTTLAQCVYTLFTLVTLAYVFAFNFSLGLVLAVYTVPCMLVVTYIGLHCTGSVGIIVRGMSLVLLAVVLVCSVFVMNSTVGALNSSKQVEWVLVSLLVGLSACTVLGRVFYVSK